MTKQENLRRFSQYRLGMFVHFGLYSLLGRGEWALNREGLDVEQYKALADDFLVPDFDADALVGLAQRAGARYVCFTTMHHEGFALYDSKVNPFNSVRHGCKRDLTAEVVEACRRRGLGIHLYHSLNHWTARPDSVDALESAADRKEFVDFAHERIRELVTLFNPIDCMWYDGWWPFNAQEWRAQEMNAMVQAIQPHIMFNGRNGLPGDFGTPEQHLTPPNPWRPWEACITHNQNWGFHAGDSVWKSSAQIVDMLTQVAGGGGNLLLNVGPDGRGRIPQPSVKMLEDLGQWMSINGDAFYGSERFDYDLQTRGDARGDWTHHGRFTCKDNTLYIHLLRWPGEIFAINGFESVAISARLLGSAQPIEVKQQGRRLGFAGLPAQAPHAFGGVLAVEFKTPPVIYNTGGLRVPKVDHCRYDPCPSDIVV